VNCAELRQRIVDPSSASTGGHAPVVAHLQECGECRSLARAFGEVERLFGAADRAVPPEDLDERIRRRLARAPGALPRLLRDPRILGTAAVVAIAIGAWLFFRPRGRETPAAPAAAPRSQANREARPAPAEGPPPAILAIRSAPIAVGGAPMSDAEKAQALGVRPREFVEIVPILIALDPFFPETLSGADPPSLRRPESPEDVTKRLTAWDDAGPTGRERWLRLDAAFGATEASRRRQVEQRWSVVADFTPDEKAGLRRLASRLVELDEKRRARLAGDIRALERFPARERRARWRALPFARGLTGQEVASAEKLLLSF
jgi:hypothetical protein